MEETADSLGGGLAEAELRKMFACITCEDTGLVWTSDPGLPQFHQADLLVPCSCQIGVDLE